MSLKENKINTYKILSVVLRYPNEQLIQFSPYFSEELKQEGLLKIDTIKKLELLFDYFINKDLMSLQEDYVSLFDRQKMFSLYLFEHIYGDSGDRGQAMVDLKNIYIASNLSLTSLELPDFIPLFIEYLSLLSVKESSILLSEPINIFSIFCWRLKQVKSLYWVVFFALEELACIKADENVVKNAIRMSKKGFKIAENEIVDKEWEEKSAFFNY